MTSTSHHRIGIVDDDGAVRDSLLLLLESHGFRAEAFDSAASFLKSGNAKFDCMVVDLHMPDMTGLELIETMRAKGNMTPAVMATGRMDPTLLARAEQAQVLTILTKPFAHGQLLEWIRRAIAGSDI